MQQWFCITITALDDSSVLFNAENDAVNRFSLAGKVLKMNSGDTPGYQRRKQ